MHSIVNNHFFRKWGQAALLLRNYLEFRTAICLFLLICLIFVLPLIAIRPATYIITYIYEVFRQITCCMACSHRNGSISTLFVKHSEIKCIFCEKCFFFYCSRHCFFFFFQPSNCSERILCIFQTWIKEKNQFFWSDCLFCKKLQFIW